VTTETVIRWVDPAELPALVGPEPLVDGLGYLQRLRDGTLPDAPAITATGAKLVEIDRGRALVHFEPQLVHCNALRQVHGGVVSTLLDTAIGYAVVSALPFGDGFSTVQLNVNFIRAIRPGEGTATIESRLVRQGRRIIVAEAEIRSADGKLCALASATCMPGR
jgi:uncharacterized protein (TIGR00369 family)